jgi:hypothetical protein
MGSVSKYFSSLENRTGTKFFPEFFFSAVRIKNLDFGHEKLLWWEVSQNAFLDLTILGAKKNFTPEIFRPKSALKSVPDSFFFGNHLPSADGKSLVKSDSNNSKLICLQRDHEPYWWWNSTRTGGTWWCIWTRIGGTWWYRSTVRRRRSNLWAELETLRELDAKISNSTQRSNRKFNKASTEKKTGQRLGLSWDVMI